MNKRKFTRKYFVSQNREEWAVTSDLGSLSFWTEVSKLDGRRYGGVEYHYNAVSRPSYFGNSKPHTDCAINGGFCWHDGSSLWATEWWIPGILPNGSVAIWDELERNYGKCLGGDDGETA